MQHNTVSKAGTYIILIGTGFLFVTAVSLYINFGRTVQLHKQLAVFTARSFFQEIVVTRRWNAMHGGVFVPVTEETQPNPYLQDPLREVTTTEGLKLTKINPAYMTRMISELLEKDAIVQFHITSLKPLTPGNTPDAWERTALEAFEEGASEVFSLEGPENKKTFRYISALKTEESCLKCHAKQGYKLGDVRGGISVSFSYAPFREGVIADNRRIVMIHGLFLTLGLATIAFLGKRLIHRVRQLQEALIHVRKLEGLLPICANCKKIRTEGAPPREQSSWEPIEQYITDRTDADFTHGLCPECKQNLYGRYVEKK